jgi:hypothetical protein
MNSLGASFVKHQKTIFLVVVVLVVLGGLYLIATMSMTKDTFANRVSSAGGNGSAGKKFSTTQPTQGDLGVDFGESAVFVFHKMDGCGHCVHFAPVWQKVAEAVLAGEIKRADGKPIVMAIVDTEHPLSAGISGYPTIRKYNSNSANDAVEFKGRTMDPTESEQNLVQFVSNE